MQARCLTGNRKACHAIKEKIAKRAARMTRQWSGDAEASSRQNRNLESRAKNAHLVRPLAFDSLPFWERGRTGPPSGGGSVGLAGVRFLLAWLDARRSRLIGRAVCRFPGRSP